MFIEQVKGLTNAGHNLAYSDTSQTEKTPKSWATPPARPHFDEMLSNEAMDRQLVDAEETSPGICRSIYKRKAITATHYAEVKVTVAGDVADYTASVLDTMAEHLAYKMNVAVGNVKITAAAGSVILSIVVGYPSASAASSGAETMNTAMADSTKAAEMLSTPAKSVTVEAVATASSGTGSAPRPVQNLEEEGEEASRSARSPASPSARRLAASSSSSASASALLRHEEEGDRREGAARVKRRATAKSRRAQPRLGESERAVSERMHSGETDFGA